MTTFLTKVAKTLFSAYIVQIPNFFNWMIFAIYAVHHFYRYPESVNNYSLIYLFWTEHHDRIYNIFRITLEYPLTDKIWSKRKIWKKCPQSYIQIILLIAKTPYHSSQTSTTTKIYICLKFFALIRFTGSCLTISSMVLWTFNNTQLP